MYSRATATACEMRVRGTHNTSATIMVNEYGYQIEIADAGGNIIDEYHAGNNRLESAPSASVDPGSPYAVDLNTLISWACNTAQEMLEELDK